MNGKKKLTLLDNVPTMGHDHKKAKDNWINVFLYEPTRKEIHTWPNEIKKDLGSILTLLQKRESLKSKDFKPMPIISDGVFEIRLKGIDGIYRVFYILKTEFGILVFHGFKKTSQKTLKKDITKGRIRLKEFLKELNNEKD